MTVSPTRKDAMFKKAQQKLAYLNSNLPFNKDLQGQKTQTEIGSIKNINIRDAPYKNFMHNHDTYLNLSRRNTIRYMKKSSNQSIDLKNCPSEPKLDDYKIGNIIGKGSYAVVRLCTNKQTSKSVAIKTYDKSKLTDHLKKQSVDREIKILKSLDHPNIIKLHECFNNKTEINLVMEFIGNRCLYDYVKSRPNRHLTEKESKPIFKMVVEAILYLHNKNISHRDIK